MLKSIKLLKPKRNRSLKKMVFTTDLFLYWISYSPEEEILGLNCPFMTR